MLRIIHSSGKVCGQIDPELSLDLTWNLAWKAKVDCQNKRGQQGKEESQLAGLFPLHIRAHSVLLMVACLQLDYVGVLVIVAILTFLDGV